MCGCRSSRPQTVARLRSGASRFRQHRQSARYHGPRRLRRPERLQRINPALADDPSVSLIAVVQDCSPGLSTRGANNYRRIAQTVADAAREIAKPVAFFNTAAGGMHPHVIEPFADTDVAVMQGARASLLAISRLFAHARFAPPRRAANAGARCGLAQPAGDRHALHGARIEGVSGRARHRSHARDAGAGCGGRRPGRRTRSDTRWC